MVSVFLKRSLIMALFLTLIFFVPAVFYCIMLINVLHKAIRFGENIPERTNQTFIFGLIAGIISVASSVAKLVLCGHGAGSLTAAAFCLLFTFFLKRIVRFFEEDFDKKHQISVEADRKIYNFGNEVNKDAGFLDENERFNGNYTDFDPR